MRRSTLLGTMVLPTVLLLGGCSGLGKFFGDTFALPGMNPNLPYGLSENTDRARGANPVAAPILPESGNIWPGPPQPLPTLSDVSRNSANGRSGNQNLCGQIGGAPPMRDGGRMSMGEQDSIANGAETFSGGGTLSGQVPDAAPRYRSKSDGQQAKPIVIPNGDGTYTVIGGDGTVKTVKSPPK